MKAFFGMQTNSMRFNGGGGGVNPGLAYSEFKPCRPQLHPTLPGLWIVGYWYGRNVATGNGDGGPVQLSLSPLPNGTQRPYLPVQDAYWTILGYSVREQGLPCLGEWHMYSDDLIGSANLEFHCQGLNIYIAGQEQILSQSWLGRRFNDIHGNGLGALKVIPIRARNDILGYEIDDATTGVPAYTVVGGNLWSYSWLNNLGDAYVMNANGLILKPEAQLVKEGLLDDIAPLRVKRA